MFRTGFKLCVALFLACTWSASSAADVVYTVSSSSGPEETDSSNVAGWFSPVLYRQAGGIDNVYFVFNAPGPTGDTHKVRVARRIGVATPSLGFLKNSDLTDWVREDDPGHNQPSIAIDGDGYLHVFASHHNDEDGWHYFKSTSPRDVANVVRNSGLDNLLPTIDECYPGVPGTPQCPRLTYPIARTAPNGDIYLVVRYIHYSTYDRRAALLRYNRTSASWSLVRVFAGQKNSAVYPDDLLIDSAGKVHIAFSWAAGAASGIRHFGSYLHYDPTSNTFSTALGTGSTTIPQRVGYQMLAPGHPDYDAAITLPSNLHYQGLQSGETFTPCTAPCTGVPGIQSAKLAVDSLYKPSIVYQMRGSGYFSAYRTRWNGASWVAPVQVSTTGHDTLAALGQTHNGTTVRAYFAAYTDPASTIDKKPRLFVSESPSWTPTLIMSPEKIKAISVVPKSANVDIIYAHNPTYVNAEKGRLFLIEHSTP